MDMEDVVKAIMERDGPVRLVAIDGPGGSGKSTLAARLSVTAGSAPVIQTDDFASADNPIDWWPRLLEQVVTPLMRNESAYFQRYDWPSESLADWKTVEPAPIVIIEGVTAGRSEWAEHLSYLIWVETPLEVRLERGIERDGEEAVKFWAEWIAQENKHYQRDPTRERADLIVSGVSPLEPGDVYHDLEVRPPPV